MLRPDSTTHRSRARLHNSLLHSKNLNEQVAWIGGMDPSISFGELVFADESRIAILAESLGLPLGGEDAHASTLNKIFRRLGVSCTDFMFFPLLIHQVTVHHDELIDPIPRHPFKNQHPPDARHDKPLMTPTEIPLYIFLAYLTMFVYANVIL